MQTRLLSLLTAAALGFGAAVGIAACGDDESNVTETVEQEATEVETEVESVESAATLTEPTETTTDTVDTESSGGLGN